MEKGGQIVGAGGAGGGWESIYENDQSDKVLNKDLVQKLWQTTNEVTGAQWPKAYQAKSPCPTLKVVGAATSLLGILEENARMKASREGEGAKIVANKTLPKAERRRHLERMLQALDKTPRDPEELERDLLRTSGLVPQDVLDGDQEHSEPSLEAVVPELDDVDDVDHVDDVDDVYVEPAEPPKMLPGHEKLGDTPVVFQPQNVMTMARAGQPLSEVASQADVFIRYKCKKGQCKTCAVNIDGKWVSACQTKVPPQEPGKSFDVRVRPVSDAHKTQEKAAFFTPKSFADGVVNNGLGVVGFVKEAFGADPDFKVRMERERLVEELLAQKRSKEMIKTVKSVKSVKSSKLRGPSSPSSRISSSSESSTSKTVTDEHGREFVLPGLAMTAAFMFAVIQNYPVLD